MVYYCNDSDGDTFLFNEFYDGKNPDKLTIAQRVTPKKNRCVVFESNRMHASSSPIYSKDRRIINFVIDAYESY
jgi:Rps23 Pro-64 3,4-dihydroxylase Tpa1-like proline 4-hydroxylase